MECPCIDIWERNGMARQNSRGVYSTECRFCYPDEGKMAREPDKDTRKISKWRNHSMVYYLAFKEQSDSQRILKFGIRTAGIPYEVEEYVMSGPDCVWNLW
jgi:hypothetical protein